MRIFSISHSANCDLRGMSISTGMRPSQGLMVNHHRGAAEGMVIPRCSFIARKASANLACTSGRLHERIPCSRHKLMTCSAATMASAPAAESTSSMPIASLRPTALLLATVVKFVMTVVARAQNAFISTFPQVADMKAEV